MPMLWKLRRRVLDQPQVRKMVDAARYWRRYGTPQPTSLRLPHSGNTLYVDRREPRGRNVLICGADGQPCTKAAWHTAREMLRPTIVVDVGLNYGEFLFDAQYAPDVLLLGVEANSSLRQWIERSAKQHPNASQLRLAFAFASDASASTQDFYIDPSSSGRSSGVRREGSKNLVVVPVPTVTIDSFFSDLSDEQLAHHRLLFKIDVEGYEPHVIHGMRRLLAQCADSVGVMEFNSQLMRGGGIDPNAFLKELSEEFTTLLVRRPEGFRPFSWQEFQTEMASGREFAADIVVLSNRAIADKIGRPGN